MDNLLTVRGALYIGLFLIILMVMVWLAILLGNYIGSLIDWGNAIK